MHSRMRSNIQRFMKMWRNECVESDENVVDSTEAVQEIVNNLRKVRKVPDEIHINHDSVMRCTMYSLVKKRRNMCGK